VKIFVSWGTDKIVSSFDGSGAVTDGGALMNRESSAGTESLAYNLEERG